MNKAILIILAVTFVCCVYCVNDDGSITERFSFEVWVENLVRIGETVTIEEMVNVWSDDYYYEPGTKTLPYWIEYYTVGTADENNQITPGDYIGRFPLALDMDGNLLEKYSYVSIPIGDALGFPVTHITLSDGSVKWLGGEFPVILNYRHMYGVYNGDIEVLEWLDSIVVFFERVYQSFWCVCDMIVGVFRNLRLILPWNAVVAL